MAAGIFVQELYRGSSQFNKDIKVLKVFGKTKLIVDGILQSSTDTRFANTKVWGQIVKLVATEKPNASRILLLGVGGGTMLKLLNKRLPQAAIVGVEIDQTIVDIAYRFFDLAGAQNTRIIVADALDVVANPAKFGLDGTFDCIIVDTSLGHVQPNETAGSDFLHNSMDLLTDGGLVVVNRIVLKENPSASVEVQAALAPHVQAVHSRVVNYPTIADNFIFYGYKKLTQK